MTNVSRSGKWYPLVLLLYPRVIRAAAVSNTAAYAYVIFCVNMPVQVHVSNLQIADLFSPDFDYLKFEFLIICPCPRWSWCRTEPSDFTLSSLPYARPTIPFLTYVRHLNAAVGYTTPSSFFGGVPRPSSPCPHDHPIVSRVFGLIHAVFYGHFRPARWRKGVRACLLPRLYGRTAVGTWPDIGTAVTVELQYLLQQ